MILENRCRHEIRRRCKLHCSCMLRSIDLVTSFNIRHCHMAIMNVRALRFPSRKLFDEDQIVDIIARRQFTTYENTMLESSVPIDVYDVQTRYNFLYVVALPSTTPTVLLYSCIMSPIPHTDAPNFSGSSSKSSTLSISMTFPTSAVFLINSLAPA